MRTILLGLAVVAPAVLVTPALAQDRPTFGQWAGNVLGIQHNDDYCVPMIQRSVSAYQNVQVVPRLRFNSRWVGVPGYDYGDNYGAFVPDLDNDGYADGSSSSSYGSSSYSSSSYGSSGSSSSSSGPVRVRSLYGAGFYFIPGTETCIKIGGYVGGYKALYNYGGFGLNAGGAVTLTVDIRTPTEFGTIRTYAAFGKGAGFYLSGGGFGWGWGYGVDRAFVQFAGLNFGGHQTTITAGRLSSAYDYYPAYTGYSEQSQFTVLQLRGSWLLGNGLGLDVALERGDERGFDGPTLVAGFGPADDMAWRASFGLTRTPWGPGIGAQFGKGYAFNERLTLRYVGALALNAPPFVGDCCGPAPGIFWSANLSGRYQTNRPYDIIGGLGVTGGPGYFGWEAGVGITRDLNANTTIGAEIQVDGGGGMGIDGAEIVFRYQRNFLP